MEKNTTVEKPVDNHKIRRQIITFSVGAGIAAAFAFARGLFSAETALDVMRHLCDAFFFAAVIFGCIGFLIFSANAGTFDMLIFGTKKFLRYAFLPSRKSEENHKETFIEYRERRVQKNPRYAHLLITSALLLAVALIFLSIYYCMY